MNHIYSVLWNSALGRFCVTSELGRSRSRSRATTRRSARRDASRHSALAALATGVALAWSAPAWSQATLPQGGQVVAGIASIGQSGRQMTVQQSSDKAIVNWQSFNIGANHQVTFQQPSHTAVALNRVIGADPTAIHGSLQANGRVFLVNPNGMLFGAGANVNVGGLVASTLNIADKDFLQGNYRFSGQGSGTQGAALRNAGRITAAEGGAVALLGGSVSNQGTIAARRGTVALAAGNQVKLDFAGDGLLNVQVQQSSLNALVENHQLIEADGGSVLMTAKATDALLQTVVNNTGTVRARTVENRAGKIVLLGGFDGGTTRVAGTLDASAPDGGDGGFVDTSGAHVQIEAGTRVTTRAAQGKTGTWLIDPTDFTISAGAGPQTASGIGADTLTANLANNNVTLQTVAAGTEAGDMHVNAAVSWNEHELTLNAHRNININAVMSVNGDGKLALNYGGTQGNANAKPVDNSNLNVTAGGRVDFAKTGMGLLAVNGHGYTVINSLAALQDMAADRNLRGKFALGGNIDAGATADWSGGGYRPIGTPSNPFRGIFDGLGHSINNLTIYRPNDPYIGLIRYARNATLRNIGLVEANITGHSSTGALVGMLQAIDGAVSISHAYATGKVSSTANAAGGLIGSSSTETDGDTRISDVYSNAQVSAKGRAGGLVGSFSTINAGMSSISNAYATGQVSGEVEVGGLVGRMNRVELNPSASGISTISNVYATGGVTATGNYVGGLVGFMSRGRINNAYATGPVQGMSSVGGLVGNVTEGQVSHAYSTGYVKGSDHTGGLVGLQNDSDIRNSYWNVDTTGQASSSGGGTGLTTAQMFDTARWAGFEFGAVWGNANGQTTPYLLNMASNQVFNRNDLPTGAITARNRPALYTAVLNVNQLQAVQNNLSGRYLLGNDIEASATAGWNNGSGFASIGSAGDAFTGVFDGLGHRINNLNIYRPDQDNVGLFGHARNAAMRNVGLVRGSVSGSSAVGMLVGLNEATNGHASVINAFATGEVTASEHGAGGLIGVNQATEGGTSTVSNSHAGGRVSGNISSGGLVGNNVAHSGSRVYISGSYATGEVSGVDDSGGLVGSNMSYGGTASIADSHASANVRVTGDDAGGLVGSNAAFGGKTTIERGYATGNVTAVNRAGGLVGSNVADDGGTASIDVAFANGNVTASGDDAGGLVGSNTASGGNATIERAYATGQVGAFGDNAGGLVGQNRGSSGAAGIDQAYATGRVAAFGSHSGGLVGRNESSERNIFRAYWDSQSTGQAESAGGGVALTTAQMKQMASFDEWNISDQGGSDAVWRIYEGQTAPMLLSFMQAATVAAMEESVTREYNGTRVFDGIEHNHSGDSRVLGTLRYTASSKNVGSYSGEDLVVGGLYSSQLGYDISYASDAGLLVTPKKISQVTGITAQDRDYNGEHGVKLFTNAAQFEGRLGNDQLNVATASGAMDTKNAGDGKAVGITGITLGGDDKNNYELVRTTASTKVDIAKALIDQVTGITAENRGYNGQKDVNLLTNGAQFEGRLGNDQLTVATASGAMDTKNAGDGKAVGITGISLGGDDKNNYELVRTTASTKVDIAKALIDEVTGITAENRTYNGGLGVNLLTNGAQFEGRLGNDQLTVATASGAMDNKNAGDGKAVGITGITLGGDDRDNYELVRTTASTKVDIAKALIDQVTGITAENRGYNGQKDVNLLTNGAQFEGRLGNDQLTVATATGAMDTKNAGDGKAVGITGISLGGDDKNNYELVRTTASTKVDIAKALIDQVTGIIAENRSYNGQRDVNLLTNGAQFEGRLGNDQLTVATASGAMDTKNAGDSKAVDITGITLGGTDAGNYTLVKTTAATKAHIDQRAIKAVITADDKTYDATMAAVTHGRLDALLGEDQVTLATNGIFATKDAGTDKTVNVSGTLSGSDAGNYRLEHNETAKADVAQRAINAVITADGKTYDATMGAATHGQLGALLGEDRVTLATSGIFATKDAGTDKTVNVSGSLAGTDAGNYRLEHNETAKADIAQRAINAVISADGKVYDATEAAVTHGQLAALLGDDQVTLSTSGSFATKDAGKDKTVNVSGSLAGRDAGNYRLEHNQTAKADIAQRTINAVISADGKIYDATEAAVTHGQLAALLGEDQVTLSTSGSFVTKDAGKDKTVNVSGALAGNDAGNYRLEHNQTAKANIAQRAINAVISADGKIYDATEAAVTHGQLAALLGQDQVTLSTSGSFATKDAGKDKTVNVSGSLAGRDAGNYRLEHNQTAKADIAQRTINAVISADGKIYDATEAAVTHGQLAVLLGEDQVTLSTSGSFVTKDAGKDKTVNVSGSLAGSDAGNYRLEHNQTAKANIARLTIQGAITAENKTYDGLMDATTHGDLGNAVLGQDQVTLITTGRFDSRNAGKNKAVALTAELKGADAGNYLLVHNDSTSADIDPRAINAVITANGKTYDATRTAMTQGQLGDRIGEDQLTLATSGSFVEKDAGTGKTVNVTGTLSGADAGNYRLVHNATAQADISQLVIHASIAADDKDYDGGIAATTRGALTGVLAGDSVALRTRGSFVDPAAGSAKLVRVGATLDGEDAGNYRLEHNASTWAAIRPEATVTAAVLTDVHAGAHPSRIEVARPEASASLSACLGDVYPLPAQVMNLGGLAVTDAQQQRQPAIVFARVGGSVSDRACARTPF